MRQRDGKLSTLLGMVAVVGALLLSAGRAEACSRIFLVFFEEPGSTSLSPRANQIMEEFVRFYQDRRPAESTRQHFGTCVPLSPGNWKVAVLAHADDPGTRDQCALSLARARVVQARLLALGLPGAIIAVEALGDQKKLVPTQPGGGDVQNRRVELNVMRDTSWEAQKSAGQLSSSAEAALQGCRS